MRLIWGGVTARRLAWEFHFRIALAFAPLVLGLFSLSAAAARRREYGPVAMGAAALTASFGYYTLLFYAREGFLHSQWLPPVVAAWAPNLLVVAMALFLFRRPLATRTQESYR
jgi:lipopolysaccharide export system permease protein